MFSTRFFYQAANSFADVLVRQCHIYRGKRLPLHIVFSRRSQDDKSPRYGTAPHEWGYGGQAG